ncbi:MAG TPA: class I SAM-dependent methyltransferase, partial [Polyangiales bacterium]
DAALLRPSPTPSHRIDESEIGPAGGCGAQDRGDDAFVSETEIRDRIEHELGREASVAQVAQAAGMPLERAQELEGVNTTFEAADAQEFSSDQKYDAIVFNEVAWYFKDPGATIARYATMLREGGILIVSMYDIIPGKLMWRSAKKHFRFVDSTQVRVGLHTWNVRMLAKRT